MSSTLYRKKPPPMVVMLTVVKGLPFPNTENSADAGFLKGNYQYFRDLTRNTGNGEFGSTKVI